MQCFSSKVENLFQHKNHLSLFSPSVAIPVRSDQPKTRVYNALSLELKGKCPSSVKHIDFCVSSIKKKILMQ